MSYESVTVGSKLILSWRIAHANVGTAYELMTDLADRLAHRVQLTSDGNKCYLSAVEDAFGAGIDYAMLQKVYGVDPEGDRRSSNARI